VKGRKEAEYDWREGIKDARRGGWRGLPFVKNMFLSTWCGLWENRSGGEQFFLGERGWHGNCEIVAWGSCGGGLKGGGG